MAVKGEYQPRVSGNAENGFYTLVVRYDSNGFGGLEEVVQHGYKGRHFKTREAGIKSAQKWIDKQMGGRSTNPVTEKLDPSIDYLFAHATKAENLIVGDEILDPMNKKFNRVVTQVDALASGLKVFARYPDGEVRTTHYNYGDIVRTKWDAGTVHAAEKRKKIMARKSNPDELAYSYASVARIMYAGNHTMDEIAAFLKTHQNDSGYIRGSLIPGPRKDWQEKQFAEETRRKKSSQLAASARKENPVKSGDRDRFVIVAYDDDHSAFYKRLDSIRGIIDYTDNVDSAKVWGTLRDAQMVAGDLRAYQKSNMVGPHPKLKAVSVATAKSTKVRGTNPVGKKMQKLEIWGKRWFQKTYGNTYHAVRVYVDDELVFVSPVEYGYGEQYVQTAVEALRGMGYDIDYPLWQWAQENGVDYSANVNDVDTQKELKEFAAPTVKTRRKGRASNPVGQKDYYVVAVKKGQKKPALYWTGFDWENTDRFVFNYKTYESAKKVAVEKAARSLTDSYQLGIYTVDAGEKK